MSRIRRVGRGFALALAAAAAPEPFCRPVGVAGAVPVPALDRVLAVLALASAMAAFVSGDVSRVAAFANLASLSSRSEAARLADRGRGLTEEEVGLGAGVGAEARVISYGAQEKFSKWPGVPGYAEPEFDFTSLLKTSASSL